MSAKFNRTDYQMENGKLPAYAFPGGYPLEYITADGGILCRDCADSDRCKEADNDPYDKQYRIIGVDINYEDNDLRCDDCNAVIECAYPPDDETTCEVIVGNIGTVYTGHDEDEARATFETYKEQADAPTGRAAGETVTLIVDNEIADEYTPEPEPQDDDYIIADRRGGGYNVYRGGTRILTTTADGFDDLLPLIRGDMEDQQFWPTVWRERERGGFDIINTTTGDII